jgi:integrase
MAEHARRFKRSAEADERNLRLHILPKWKNRPYLEIQRRDVIALAESMIGNGKAIQANRVQALVSSIYSFAIDADLAQVNPCHRLRKRGVETPATRALSDAEIRLFWNRITCSPVSPGVGLALRLILLTGARASEVAGAAVSEFEFLDDPSRAVWTIPAVRSKNGRPHYLPLSSLAIATAQSALKLPHVRNPFLFPSRSSKPQPIARYALPRAMVRFSEALEGVDNAVDTWREQAPCPHDLRRTLATRLASLGIPAEDIAAVLNHTRQGVTSRHYDLYDRAREKRDALEAWARALKILIGASVWPSELLRVEMGELGDRGVNRRQVVTLPNPASSET